jgi:acyl-CoA synthetase (AMP-forming)/AMP-acid ligase II
MKFDLDGNLWIAGRFYFWGESGLAMLSADQLDGYVEIRDRLKDVIISGGENISSVEVEGALLRHPAVQEVAIVGMPDERWGEAPHAFVVLKSRRDHDGNRAAQLRSLSSGALQGAAENSLRTRAAKNSDGQGPEVCPSRQACDFEAVTGQPCSYFNDSTVQRAARQMSNACSRSLSEFRRDPFLRSTPSPISLVPAFFPDSLAFRLGEKL